MKETIKYNDISDRLREEIGTIPKGGKYVFELRTVKMDTHDDDPQYHRLIGTGPTTIPNRCTIRDPHKPEGQQDVELAYIEGHQVDGTPIFGDITFEPSESGQITCYHGKIKDQRLYQYLKLCLWNESNPYRDKGLDPLFKEVNPTKESEQEFDILELKDMAISKYLKMEIDDVKAYLKRFNKPHVGTDKEVKLRLRKMVESDPKTFINSLENKDEKMLSVLALAHESGVIHHDHSKGMWAWESTGDKITQYSKTFKPGDTKYTKLLDFIKEDSNGKLVYEEIQLQLKGKQEKQQAVLEQ